ncbi:13002_t:CDS:1, partial [Racocetra persica]
INITTSYDNCIMAINNSNFDPLDDSVVYKTSRGCSPNIRFYVL